MGRQLLDYAKEHGLTPQGILRHTYLEGPPQHKDPAQVITQVILPIVYWYFAQRLPPDPLYPPELSPAGTVKSGFHKGRRFKTVGPYIGSAQKSQIPPSEISIFLHIRTSDPVGAGRSIFRVFIFARN